MKSFPFRVAAGALLMLVLALPLHAQDGAAGPMAQIVTVEPMPGHANAMEAGSKKHMEWYAGSGGGTWVWAAFEIVMGERTGQYVWFSGGHNYADFDEADVDQAMEAESIDKNIVPHVAGVNVQLTRLRADLSITGDNAVRPIYDVITIKVKSGADARFENFLAKVKEAFEGGEDQLEYSVYQSAQGGTTGAWVISIGYENFAAMDLDPSMFVTLMTAAHGQFETTAILESLGDIIVSEASEIFVLRPDLSVNLPGN